ncbi:MAG: spore cortex biosynthesis protein YabQ, partial [Clostridia bacterium]|nr:spore cortex biosynthesis protein YabQ [Clostridia bacterium]
MIGELSHLALAQLLFLSIAFGFFAGALYDIFRIRRIALKIPILWHFEDFFFMVFCGVTYAVLFYALNSGRVRGFAFVGGIVGLYIYRKTLGRLVMALSERIISFVKYILRKIILPPIK